ncbi:MAG: hypothetical protein F2563_04190 [Actinobacteria bacterium]|nr:hypothetical protein [Actinomycetota bacterium]
MEPTVHIFAAANTELDERNTEIRNFIGSFPEKQKFIVITDEPNIQRQLRFNSRKLQIHYAKQSDHIYNLLFAAFFIKQSEEPASSEEVKKDIHADGVRLIDSLITQGAIRESEIRGLRDSQVSTFLLMKLEIEIRKLESPIFNREVIDRIIDDIHRYSDHVFDNHFIVQPLADICAINLFIKFIEIYNKNPDKHYIITSSMDSFPNFIDILYERHTLVPVKVAPVPLITVIYQNIRINIRNGKFIEEKNLTRKFRREIHDKASSSDFVYIPVLHDAPFSKEYETHEIPVTTTDNFVMNHNKH